MYGVEMKLYPYLMYPESFLLSSQKSSAVGPATLRLLVSCCVQRGMLRVNTNSRFLSAQLGPAVALAPATIPPPIASVNQPPLRCLVVDDEAVNRRLCTRMLTRQGCEVEALEDGDMVSATHMPLGTNLVNCLRKVSRFFHSLLIVWLGLEGHVVPLWFP